jgi:hypothetical protein
MNSKGTMNVRRGHFRSLMWLGVAAILFTVSPGSYSDLFASDNSTPCITSTRQAAKKTPEPATPGCTKVAEGEYRVLGQSGIGEFVPAVYDFRESWTLCRLEDGTFEVSGTRSYRSPADEPHSDNFEARLSAGLSVTELKEFRRLRWRPDTGPLTCDFLPGKVACTATSKDKTQNLTLDVPVQGVAGLLWPISAFSLSSIARSASHDPKTITPVELLTFEEISGADPVFTKTLGGYLKCLGQEKLFLAGREWLADKFELKIATHPPFLLWTSSQGLLLAFAYEKDSDKLSQEGMILAMFHE